MHLVFCSIWIPSPRTPVSSALNITTHLQNRLFKVKIKLQHLLLSYQYLFLIITYSVALAEGVCGENKTIHILKELQHKYDIKYKSNTKESF